MYYNRLLAPRTSSRKQIDANALKKDVTEDYELLEELGKGTFSTVFKAKNGADGTEVAVKVIDKVRTDADLISEEVTTMRSLKGCPRVVNLIDTYETDSKFYIVMELVRGGELFDKIASKGYYSEADGKLIIKQILEGIAYMHARNLVHRDLKPENLLCATPNPDELSDVKLSDFGLAKVVAPGTTLSGKFGSPQYMAPEIWAKKPYGLKVDMWSLGVISFILLGGYFPFAEGNGRPPLESQIMEGLLTFDEDSWNDVSDVAKDFIRKLLVVDPEKRLSAVEALNHKFMQGETPAASTDRSRILERIKRFNARRKFKSAVLAVITSNRMARLMTVTNKIKEGWQKVNSMASSESSESRSKKQTNNTNLPSSPVTKNDGSSSPSSSSSTYTIRLNSLRLFANYERAFLSEVRQVSVKNNTVFISNLPSKLQGNTLFIRTADNEHIDITQMRIQNGTVYLHLASNAPQPTSLLLNYETRNLYVKIGYHAVLGDDMSSIELTGYYNIVNRCGYAINASSVIIEQYSDVTSEIKEGLSIANNEEINIMFLSRVKLPIVEEASSYAAKILTDTTTWYIPSNEQVPKLLSGSLTLYLEKRKRKQPSSLQFVASGWLAAKFDEERDKSQRSIKQKRSIRHEGSKRLLRWQSVRHIPNPLDSPTSPDKSIYKFSSRDKINREKENSEKEEKERTKEKEDKERGKDREEKDKAKDKDKRKK